MDKSGRFKIGIIFNFTQGWLGGVYYYQNIIKALDFLDDEEKPEIIIFYNKEYAEHLKDIVYPYLQLVPWQFTGVYKGYFFSFFKRENIFVDEMIKAYQLDGIYPVNDNPIPASTGIEKNTVAAAWFPDLQHKFFPQFFDKKRLWLRELRLKITLRNATDLVVSSNDTVNHFKRFYKIPEGLRIHVLQFVSILDQFNGCDIEKIRALYKLPDQYYVVSNGFLKHKNHLTVLKALKVLTEQKNEVHIIFTGRVEIQGNSEYIAELTHFINENGLSKYISLLGVIPRHDQLCIMRHSKAVLQPSMFEGWNTTIEDAKTLGVPVIASGIEVHKEQLGENGLYFDPEDDKALAKLLNEFSISQYTVLHENNEERIKSFAKNFMKIFRN
jgi:glycosyltransferase involved in cell wall biosynthesis